MNQYELLVIAIVIRVVGDFHDGISARGPGVSWWYWHGVNWLRRDLIIAWIVFQFLGWPWQSFDRLADWVLVAALNIIIHRVFYLLGTMTHKERL